MTDAFSLMIYAMLMIPFVIRHPERPISYM